MESTNQLGICTCRVPQEFLEANSFHPGEKYHRNAPLLGQLCRTLLIPAIHNTLGPKGLCRNLQCSSAFNFCASTHHATPRHTTSRHVNVTSRNITSRSRFSRQLPCPFHYEMQTSNVFGQSPRVSAKVKYLLHDKQRGKFSQN